ncbi:response regulator [Sphingobium amiense]|uniref:Response regulator n=1 Tax=Sphingobium amiense TaxID=135719 RepID=A0A494W2I5_9SPHN|nr:response regulator [Sphingobium amiense]BBD98843.1 response regulator [Sphingobium amiense]
MSKSRILVVEDQALLRWHAVDMIENAGFIALEAEDADAAIASLKLSADVQLVFTDIEMPGSMDGIQLAALIRDRWPSMHVIVTSGREPVDVSTLPAGCPFVAKPPMWPALIETMRCLTAA